MMIRDLVAVDVVLVAAGVRLVSLRVHTQQGDMYDPVEHFLLVRGRRYWSRSGSSVSRYDRRLPAHLQQGTRHTVLHFVSRWSWRCNR